MTYALYSVAGYPLPNIAAGLSWVAGGLLFGIATTAVGRWAMRTPTDATREPQAPGLVPG
jgi:hypothetical protein